MARLLAVLEPDERETRPVGPPRPEPSSRIPAVAIALGIAGAALLVIGTLLQADTFAHPDFGPADRLTKAGLPGGVPAGRAT